MNKWGVALAAAAMMTTGGVAQADDAPVIDHGVVNAVIQDGSVADVDVVNLNAPLIELPDLPSLSLVP